MLKGVCEYMFVMEMRNYSALMNKPSSSVCRNTVDNGANADFRLRRTGQKLIGYTHVGALGWTQPRVVLDIASMTVSRLLNVIKFLFNL